MNMKTLTLSLVLAVLLCMPANATTYGGQNDTTNTTLSAAVTISQNNWCLASATGVVVRSATANGSYLVVDSEAAQVQQQQGGTGCYSVKRGQLGTVATAH